MARRLTLQLTLIALALAALAMAGCGTSGEDGSGSKPPDYKRLLAGSPAPLAALHKQANQLLPGGNDAYEERLAALAGYPVVANFWASWCNPCRVEFPALQRLSARFGKQVAFLGVNTEDDADAAKTFLTGTPVPYPSYSDPDAGIRDSIGGRGLPNTAFYDREGNLCFKKIGQYPDLAELEADVRRFAVREECESG
ncbi:MAG TPA: TlpA disulfide reductase family protein [Solirubrobacterales bacterium]|jgi:thiol-disulfide isomerase/thioredoxin|nr:TlpA disulfide reductase family protein [Solirubrobacterales bacterium]